MRLGPKRVPAIPRPIQSGQIMNRTTHPLTEMRKQQNLSIIGFKVN